MPPLTNILKICGAAGLGVCTSLGLHFYSILVSRTKSDLIRFILFLLFLALFIGGGFIGCAAIAGGFFHGEKTFAPSVGYLRGAVLLAWVVIVWIYIIINWRTLKQRLRRRTNR